MIFRQPHVWLEFSAPKWVPNWVGTPFKKLFDAELWVRNRIQPSRMHHVVFTELPPGWHDVDVVMTEAMIALLKRYVEEEEGGIENLKRFTADLQHEVEEPVEGREFEADMLVGQVSRQSEIVTLYEWFTITRPAMEAEHHELLGQWAEEVTMQVVPVEGSVLRQLKFSKLSEDGERAYRRAHEIENQLRAQTTEMLVRLVKVRESMWT